MPDTEALAIIGAKAAKMLAIAEGIFDNGERRIVLNFVAAAELVAAERARDKAATR